MSLLLREALLSFRRAPLLSLLSITAIAFSLFTVGLFGLVALNLHWKNGKVKCEIALAKGKAEHDKRSTIKDREGKREVERAMKERHK